jgi:hypothetical protein
VRFPLLAVLGATPMSGPRVAQWRPVRGVQWWNSSAWTSSDPDVMVWTSRRSLRRARLLRTAAFAFVVTVGAAAGALAALLIWVH